MKFDYPSLLRDKPVIDLLELQSFDMNIYLLKLYMGKYEGILFEHQSPMRFYSTQHVREAFTEITVLKAMMVHETPYDEMIANPPKSTLPARIPFSMQQPY